MLQMNFKFWFLNRTCKDRNSLKCEAKIIQDIKTQKLKFGKNIKHTHPPCFTRRKAGKFLQKSYLVNSKTNFIFQGELKKMRKKFGLDEPTTKNVKKSKKSKLESEMSD